MKISWGPATPTLSSCGALGGVIKGKRKRRRKKGGKKGKIIAGVDEFETGAGPPPPPLEDDRLPEGP